MGKANDTPLQCCPKAVEAEEAERVRAELGNTWDDSWDMI